MEEGIFKLTTDFADIVVEAHKWLKNRYPDAEDAAVWLNQVLKIDKKAPFVVCDVRNHSQLIKQLQKSFHYTAPDSLHHFIRITRREDLIKRIEEYKEDLKNFCRTIIITVNEKRKEIELAPHDMSKPCLILKFLSVTSFDEIEAFLDDCFGIDKRYLRTHKIGSGCVEVTLQFEASMEQHFQDCIDKMKERKADKLCVKMFIESAEILDRRTQKDTAQPDVKGKDIKKTKIPQGLHQYELRQRPILYMFKTRSRRHTTQTYTSIKTRKRAYTSDALTFEGCKRAKESSLF